MKRHQVVGWALVLSGPCWGLALAASTDWIVARQQLPGVFGRLMDRHAISVSADGRFVAFTSLARLSPLDTNDLTDVYVLDLERSVLTLESITTAGTPANGDSMRPSLSGDGRFLVFDSLASNLTSDTGTVADTEVYLRDRRHAQTRRLLIANHGSVSALPSSGASISADGRFVVLAARAAGQSQGQVYRLSLDSGDATLVSVMADGRSPASGGSFNPSISDDGHLVSFESEAALDPLYPPAAVHMVSVYVRDLDAGTTLCVGCVVEGAGVRRRTLASRISGDGKDVVFVADELIQVDGQVRLNGNIWLYDRVSSATTLVTRASNGQAANGSSRAPVVSASGDVIVFESDASNLACARRCSSDAGDENLLPDIYRYDRRSGRTTRISGRRETWWDPSVSPAMDASGRVIAFSSRHPVGPLDLHSDFDLFVWINPASSVVSDVRHP